ncbi:glycine-rich protein [Raphanus sativus]|uniref:Glycine-rich cell wall structural protein 1 n=1 Tax=Raphanus sativus TaxID=3726 RepID=A0A6J0MEJ1_RAPSA|nr:glycine-rich cell wall structural protein 1 [Raphanus sativus]KAJ4909892.1 glycine-rich protein [Raphanus sativus]
MRSDNLWTRKPEVKTGKSEFPVIRFLRRYIENIKDNAGGPGIGGGIGCGAGLGLGLAGGLGLVTSEGINHSNVVFGIGVGCGIGVGFGYGFGVGGGLNFDDIGDKLTYGNSSG